MLKKANRLNLKKSYGWIKDGQRIETPYFRLNYKLGANDNPKVGIAVSSSVFKKAVERNQVKRLIFSSFEDLYSQLIPNLNIMVAPKLQILTIEVPILVETLKNSLKERLLLNDN